MEDQIIQLRRIIPIKAYNSKISRGLRCIIFSSTLRSGDGSCICGFSPHFILSGVFTYLQTGYGKAWHSSCRNMVLAKITLWNKFQCYLNVYSNGYILKTAAWPLKCLKFTVSQFQTFLGESQETVTVIVLVSFRAKISLLCREQQTSCWTSFHI